MILLEEPAGWESVEKEWRIDISFLSNVYLEVP